MNQILVRNNFKKYIIKLKISVAIICKLKEE